MKNIYILLDYKNRFITKTWATPYRSGMDKLKLRKYFEELGYNAIFKNFSEIDFRNESYKNAIILYTSSEDEGLHYQSYIKDIIYALMLQGAQPIPEFTFLMAHDNKVFMEFLRDLSNNQEIKNIQSKHYGCLEEFESKHPESTSKSVFKLSNGATSKNVWLSVGKRQALAHLRRKLSTFTFKSIIYETIRSLRHKNYTKESQFRRKFITQNFIDNLKGDWKVLVYWDQYYVVQRFNRKNDFRASGSGKRNYDFNINHDLLNFAKRVFQSFNVPCISLDIASNNGQYYLIEFQMISFGTSGYEQNHCYYIENNGTWLQKKIENEIEKVYCRAISLFLETCNGE